MKFFFLCVLVWIIIVRKLLLLKFKIFYKQLAIFLIKFILNFFSIFILFVKAYIKYTISRYFFFICSWIIFLFIDWWMGYFFFPSSFHQVACFLWSNIIFFIIVSLDFLIMVFCSRSAFLSGVIVLMVQTILMFITVLIIEYDSFSNPDDFLLILMENTTLIFLCWIFFHDLFCLIFSSQFHSVRGPFCSLYGWSFLDSKWYKGYYYSGLLKNLKLLKLRCSKGLLIYYSWLQWAWVPDISDFCYIETKGLPKPKKIWCVRSWFSMQEMGFSTSSCGSKLEIYVDFLLGKEFNKVAELLFIGVVLLYFFMIFFSFFYFWEFFPSGDPGLMLLFWD